ncbi:MAG: bifunctional 3-(3-hydroxy-phenyl)propionate/3-hydroxycinnamic acid hydroxylase [Acetobacteraceae bacterium]|nr:bifunctional 3-(3-hydroxy-phenyl)propionate/3-hydroxycinnamic acid hydroxylase [Acetobacteraceae bacterium]
MTADAPRTQPFTETEVAIIGFGPAGATLANLLGSCGISVLVLEREGAVYPLPRAVHFDDEVMRVLQTVGLTERVLPHTHVSPGMRFVDAQGRLLLDWSRPMDVGPQGWNASYRFHQPDFERILQEGAKTRPGVQVRLRSEVFAIRQDDKTAYVEYEDLSNGTLKSCRARYVVGCDGARSLVRRLIGSPVEDLGFHERWLVVDALLKRPVASLGEHSVQYCDPARPATYVRGVGNRRRWEIALLPGEDGTAMAAPDAVWRLLSRWIAPEDAELERAVSYTFHSGIAERWRSGRLLIAGDSAHQTPPFLGQGMCAGVRDAANLAWKLARVLRGQADDAVLDTYESERSPHVRAYIESAVRLGGLINTKAAEAALPGGMAREEPARMETIKPRLGPGLAAGWTGPAGQVAPQPRLKDGTLLDDHVGYRFAALLQSEFVAKLSPAILDRCAHRDIAIVTDEAPDLQNWLGVEGAGAVLVRPDRYVLGGARTAQEMETLIAAV